MHPFHPTATATLLAILAAHVHPATQEDSQAAVLRPIHRVGASTATKASLMIEIEQRSGTYLVNGEDGMEHDARRRLLIVQRAQWEDEVLTANAQRPSTFTRKFGEVIGGFGLEDIGKEPAMPEEVSPLGDRVVRFEWCEEEALFDREFQPRSTPTDEADEVLLEGLVAVINFAKWLPGGGGAGEVKVGQRWKVKAAAAGGALLPLGKVLFGSAESHRTVYGAYTGFTSPVPPPSPLLWWDAPNFGAIDGEVDVHLKGVTKDGGEAIAELEVLIDVNSERDATSWLEACGLGDYFHPADSLLTIATRLEGKGVLLWNVDRGYATDWTFDGDLEVDLNVQWILGRSQPQFHCDAAQRWTGTVRSRVHATRSR